MRVTNNLLIHNMLWNMNNNLVSMNDKQTKLATGEKIQKPSDDPVDTTRIIKVKSDIAENEQFKENVRDAESWLAVSENSLMDIKDILQRIRELAVQGANGTNTEGDTTKIASEIDQLIEEVIVNANSTMAGRYLFSGFNTDEPLLNEDGSYNINITSEKLNDFKSIAYEVAVGESLEVGVNYLDVYGAVLNDNVVTDTFVFGDVKAGELRVGENESNAAKHSKIKGPADYTKDLSAETMTVTVGAVTYTVDASKLDGKITQEEYVEILKAAEQTVPAASYPIPTLSEVADIYFVASDDPDNEDGELVIEANTFGSTTITLGGTAVPFKDNPNSISGTDVVAGVAATFEGTFDFNEVYSSPSKLLGFKVSGTYFYVTTSSMDGSIIETDFLNLLNNAKSPEGQVLSDYATITFDSFGGVGSVGTLSLEAKYFNDETITYLDEGDGFSNPATTVGATPVYASLTGPFSNTADLSSSVLRFSYLGNSYSVNTSTMDGTISDVDILTLIQNAGDGFGNTLDDIANITYDGTTLTISSDTTDEGRLFGYYDPSGAFSAAPTVVKGVEAITPDFEGSFDIADVVGQAMTFDFGGQIYTVDTSGLTAANFEARVQGALDGSGNPFSGVASIAFNVDSGDVGNLSIISNTDINSEIVINNLGLLRDVSSTTIGVASADATAASLESIVDINKILSSPLQTLSYEVDGTTYSVDTSQLDGTITQGAFIDLIENADDGSGNLLKSVADITFTAHSGEGNIGTLKIEDQTVGAGDIIVGGSGSINVTYPVTSGIEKAKITGDFDFSTNLTAETLAFEIDGVTYTVDTTTFDGTITEADFITAIENADDGSGNLLSTVADVAFALEAGTGGVLTIEENSGAYANVGYLDTGGAFTSEPTLSSTEIDAIITGMEEITDAMLTNSKKGEGVQSFVVTYDGETKRIDIGMTTITTMAEMTTAINDKLEDAFGLNDDTPPTNNVSFEIFNDGEKNVVRFIGDGKNDGSVATLKVDVIISDKPEMIQDLEEFSQALSNKDDGRIDQFLGEVDVHLDNVIKTLANIGAKNNRLDFIENRIDDNNIAMTEILSKVQDVDYAKVTIEFKSLESIYRASLSVGAKVIQPTLVDFMQ